MQNKLIISLALSIFIFGFYSQGQEKMTPAWNRQRLFQHALELAAQSKEGKNEKIFAVLNLYKLLNENQIKAARIESMFFVKERLLDKDLAIILIGCSLMLQNKFEEALSTINYFIEEEEQRQSVISEIIQSVISDYSISSSELIECEGVLDKLYSGKEKNEQMTISHAMLCARIGDVDKAVSLVSKLELHIKNKVLELAVSSLLSQERFEEAFLVASQINQIETKINSFIAIAEYYPAGKNQAVELLDNYEKSSEKNSIHSLVNHAIRLHKLGMNTQAKDILKKAESVALADKDVNNILNNLMRIAEKYNQIGDKKSALGILDKAGNIISSCEKSVSICASFSVEEVKFQNYCRLAILSAEFGEINQTGGFIKSALEYYDKINAMPSDNIQLAKTFYLINDRERSLETLGKIKYKISRTPEHAALYRAWMDFFEIASTKQDYDFAMELMNFCDEDLKLLFCIALLINSQSLAL